jgi:hypothetical protein
MLCRSLAHNLLYSLIAIALLPLLGGCDDVLLPTPGLESTWIPLAVGNTWRYQWRSDIGSAAGNYFADTIRFGRDTLVDGVRWFGDGDVYYIRQPDGFYRVNLRVDGWRTPIRIIAIPPRLGDTISTDAMPISVAWSDSLYLWQYVRTLDAIDTTIVIAGGTFKCIRTATLETLRPAVSSGQVTTYLTHDYYVLQLGRVKSESWRVNDFGVRQRDFLEELVSLYLFY